MKTYDCTQGSREWLRLRMGRPTASSFDRIVTPGGRVSEAQDGYLRELIAELIMGRPIQGPTMPWMERGKDLESKAVDFYEFQKDVETQVVGFCVDDSERYGASPDRLVGDTGLLEIKCPSPEVHVGYLLFEDVSKKYKAQCQGQLLVTGREWLEIVSFHPEMPPALVRVERDEKYIALLSEQLDKFCTLLECKKLELSARGMLAREEENYDVLGVTDDDVLTILLQKSVQAVEQRKPVPHDPELFQ